MSPAVPGPRRAPARGKRSFAATWWGQAWVAALEDSTLDAGRLSRGRTYARKGMVGPVTVAPGKVNAAVQGSRPRPYRSSVHLPVLTDPQWDTLLDTKLPELPEPAAHTTALPVAPPPGTGLAAADLERLMADATARAARLLAGDTADLHLTQHQDAVRIAASNPGPEWFHHLIQNTNTKPTAFACLTRAWRHGGPTGITVAEQPYAPDPTVMKATRTALDAALAEMTDSPTHLRTWTASPSPTTASSCVWAPTPAGTPTSRTTTANGGPRHQPTVTRSPRSPRPGRRTGSKKAIPR
ncbi:hypothetical protein [Streptomyces sp. TRM68367]|uniref:SWIM zinc finger family protein n=1 Tax=Streptomyces sp. TRM68367 TaxID=2758415 RepID=UPI0021CFD9FF|nr:hypothetical protein [Streptomyces sp. TRM68367]